jgi:hypothetical protein
MLVRLGVARGDDQRGPSRADARRHKAARQQETAMKRHRSWKRATLAAALFAPALASAHLTRLVITSTVPLAGGAAWGHTGAYERLTGKAYFEVDPDDPADRIVTDIDKAPRNASGRVEFSTDVMIVKPVDMTHGNHKVFYRINNRGNDSLLNAQTVQDVGDNDVFLKMGYTIVDAGWEGDIVPVASKLVAYLPVAEHADGSAITGPMRYEYSDRTIPLTGTFTMNLEGNAAFTSYPAEDTDTSHATFVWRSGVNAPPNTVAPDRWAFGTCPTGEGSLTPTRTDICYYDGFQNNLLYQLVYTAKDPIVMALGHATTRDFASFLRFEKQDDEGHANPLGPGIRRMYADGCSQTGGYIRDYLYLGFNGDEKGRRVFDGMIPECAGTDRVFINVRFADPNTWSDEDDRHDFLQSSYPPFNYAVQKDPLSGIHAGVLHRPKTDPLVFQIDSASEFWQLRDSLNVLNGKGRPVPVPDNVRMYYVAATAHGGRSGGLQRTGGTPPPGSSPLCANPTPSISVDEPLRALLVAMDDWADRGIEPPRPTYPVPYVTLVPLSEARKAFPDVPGVMFPDALNDYRLLDFGPKFGKTGGVLTIVPPLLGPSYHEYVPLEDSDGIDTAGIPIIQAKVPLGTVTGWNIRAPGHRAPDLCSLTGTYIPFATTKAERIANGDPRPSLQERYHDHPGYVEAVRKAAQQLVRDRYLLLEDARAFVDAAEKSAVLR